MEVCMPHRLEHLNCQDVVIDKLTVHSLEMGLYLAEVDFDGRSGYIVGPNNRPQPFSSASQVKQELAAANIKQAFLVHASAYDEMIGQGDKVDNRLVIPI
jgi:hypothetical protein